jgi:RNA polymerase sigma factor (sigma-70 family)
MIAMASRAHLGIPPPFEETMRQHEREIMRFLLRMTREREDALDLFQETWLRAYRAYPQLESHDGLRPWLFRIASNLCRNRARDRARHSRVIADVTDSADHHTGPAHNHAAPEGAIDLRRAIQSLPGKQGRAFVMRKVIGLDYGEIGAALGCSSDSARASVYQALQKLKATR